MSDFFLPWVREFLCDIGILHLAPVNQTLEPRLALHQQHGFVLGVFKRLSRLLPNCLEPGTIHGVAQQMGEAGFLDKMTSPIGAVKPIWIQGKDDDRRSSWLLAIKSDGGAWTVWSPRNVWTDFELQCMLASTVVVVSNGGHPLQTQILGAVPDDSQGGCLTALVMVAMQRFNTTRVEMIVQALHAWWTEELKSHENKRTNMFNDLKIRYSIDRIHDIRWSLHWWFWRLSMEEEEENVMYFLGVRSHMRNRPCGALVGDKFCIQEASQAKPFLVLCIDHQKTWDVQEDKKREAETLPKERRKLRTTGESPPWEKRPRQPLSTLSHPILQG